MTAGHFGFAAGMKSIAPRLPLWALMVSAYLLDIIFIVLYPFGIESLIPVDSKHLNAYGGMVIHAYYTHLLLGALLISAVAGGVAAKIWGRRNGVVIASVVFSHWVLDLLAHRPNLPLLPNNLGHLPLLSFGLWRFPLMSASLELLLILGGSYFYYRAAARLPIPNHSDARAHRWRVLTASGLTLGLFASPVADGLSGCVKRFKSNLAPSPCLSAPLWQIEKYACRCRKSSASTRFPQSLLRRRKSLRCTSRSLPASRSQAMAAR